VEEFQSMQSFYKSDNKIISKIMISSWKEDDRDMLESEEFLFFLR